MSNNVLLFLSDATTYILKADSDLKNLCTKIPLYTTCKTHALHRIAEEIRGQLNAADELILSMKNNFRKAPDSLTVIQEVKLKF